MVNFDQITKHDMDNSKIIAEPMQEFEVPRPRKLSKIFIMKRGLYRDISAYYKNQFSDYINKWNNLRCEHSLKSEKMESFILEYIIRVHNDYFQTLSETHKQLFTIRLKEILFSNRYKKSDSFLRGCNFNMIRKLLYSYSVNLRDKYLKCPHN